MVLKQSMGPHKEQIITVQVKTMEVVELQSLPGDTLLWLLMDNYLTQVGYDSDTTLKSKVM